LFYYFVFTVLFCFVLVICFYFGALRTDVSGQWPGACAEKADGATNMGESDENSRGLDLVESIQGETKERLVNIQRTLGETTTVAEQTEAALAEQMHQIQSTDEELTRLHSVMETSKKLLNKCVYICTHARCMFVYVYGCVYLC
jgi:hypothetical protein